MMSTEALVIGLHHLIADTDSPFCRAVVVELARLYVKCGEPLPALLRHYAPTGYEQSGSFEVLREDRNNE